MEKRDLICIGCPMGCALEVSMEDGQVTAVYGQACKRGEDYGRKECTDPTRILTTTVPVEGGELEMVSVKTERDIPKDKIFACIKVIKNVKMKAPVQIGDIVVKDILGTGVNIVATSGTKGLQRVG